MIRLPRPVPSVVLLVALTLSLCAARASAQDAKPFPDAAPGTWGDGFPTVASVLEYARTDDPLETAKRRTAALKQIEDMVEVMSGNMAYPSPYDGWAYYREVDAALKEGLTGAEADARAREWAEESFRRKQDPVTREALVNALFTPEWRERHWDEYLRLAAERDAELQAYEDRMRPLIEAEEKERRRREGIPIPMYVALPFLALLVGGFVWLLVGPGRRARGHLAREQAEGRSLHSFTSGGAIVDVTATTGTIPSGGISKLTRAEITPEGRIVAANVLRDDLHLVDDEGVEHSFRLHGFDLECRPGNRLSVLHAVQRGRSDGRYVVVQNWTTRKGWWDASAIDGLTSVGCLWIVVLTLVTLVVCKSSGLGMVPSFGIGLAVLVLPGLVLRGARARDARRHVARILDACRAGAATPAA